MRSYILNLPFSYFKCECSRILMEVNCTVNMQREPFTNDYFWECKPSHVEESPRISLSNMSSSAFTYSYNSGMSALVFCKSNPYSRLISLSSTYVMVSAFIQLMGAFYKRGRCAGILTPGSSDLWCYFTLKQVKGANPPKFEATEIPSGPERQESFGINTVNTSAASLLSH